MRSGALYAFADTREPAAIDQIRQLLRDPNQDVRFRAACLLTEVQDASGLSEMKEALHRLRNYGPNDDFKFYMEAETLLPAFERMTGKSFGELPLMPGLLSNSSKGQDAGQRFHELVNAWAEWFVRTPAPK